MIEVVFGFEATFLVMILKSTFYADLDVSRRELSNAIFKCSLASLQPCLFSYLSKILKIFQKSRKIKFSRDVLLYELFAREPG